MLDIVDSDKEEQEFGYYLDMQRGVMDAGIRISGVRIINDMLEQEHMVRSKRC